MWVPLIVVGILLALCQSTFAGDGLEQKGQGDDTSTKPRKIYSEADIIRLGFTHDERNPLPKEDVRKIKNRLQRARAAPPNELREIRSRGPSVKWITTAKTNAEYVDEYTEAARQRMKRYESNPDNQVKIRRKESGWNNRKRRIAEASTGNPSEIMLMRDRYGNVRKDKKMRTKEEYLAIHRGYRQKFCEKRAETREAAKALTSLAKGKQG